MVQRHPLCARTRSAASLVLNTLFAAWRLHALHAAQVPLPVPPRHELPPPVGSSLNVAMSPVSADAAPEPSTATAAVATVADAPRRRKLRRDTAWFCTPVLPARRRGRRLREPR